MKRIRIKDIAAQAGVSTGTVDRVLHQRGDVSAKAREKVKAAMEELGYERNLIASTLAYNRTLTLAVLLPYPETDEYWLAIHEGIQRAKHSLQHFGLNLETVNFELASPRHFAECANRLLSQPPAAFLFAPLFQLEGMDLARQLQALDIPYIMINTRLAEANALCYVGQDAYQAGFLGARLLHSNLPKGQHPLIIHLEQQVDNAPHLLAKAHGFRAYFNQPEIAIPTLTEEITTFDNPQTLINKWATINKKHDNIGAIFVTNSRAHLLANALADQGHPIPPIVGFDPIPTNLAALQQGNIQFLINQHPKAQGYLGASTLSDYLLRQVDIPPDKLLPLDIVVRENMAYLGNLDILVGVI
jgi:LacI family transcriptional regulator